MRIKIGKTVFKYLRAFIFLLLLLKGAFSLKAAYAQSTTGCLANPVCKEILKTELKTAIAAPTAPTGTGFGASTLSVTTPTGVSTTVNAVAKVVFVVGATTSAYALWNYWDEAHNEWAQSKARERYCTVYPSDMVCLGQLPGVHYRIIGDIYWEGATNGTGPNNTWATVFQPVTIHFDSINNSGPYQPYGPIHAVFLTSTLQSPPGTTYGINPKPVDYYYWNLVVSRGNPPNVGDWITGSAVTQPGQPPILKNLQIFPVDGQPDTGLPLKNWPQAKRDAAVDLLTDSDWQELRESMPEGGVLGPGDAINAPTIVEGEETDDPNTSEDERQPKKLPGPLIWPTNADNPYTFPSPLNEELTQRQKNGLMGRIRAKRLSLDGINNGITRPIPNDPNNRRCFYTELSEHEGNYPPHSQYATRVTGSVGDIFVMTPNGFPFITYDGEVKATGASAYSVGESQGAVAEVKTQHLWLIKVARGYPLTAKEKEKWDELKIQLNRQAEVARVCNLRYFIAFDNQNVANIAGPYLVNMLSPIYPQVRIYYLP